MKVKLLFSFFSFFLCCTVQSKSYECALNIHNSLDREVSIIYRSYYPSLYEPFGKYEKIVVSSLGAEQLHFVNVPFVKVESVSPTSKATIKEDIVATTCNKGGILVIEKRT